MKRTQSAIRAGLALATLAAAFGPGVSHATQPTAITMIVDSNPITPYNSGNVMVHGNVPNLTNNMVITVTATDFSVTLPSTSVTYWRSSDSAGGHDAGDYQATLNVTNIGTHDGTTVPIYLNAHVEDKVTHESKDSGLVAVQKSSADPLDTFAPEAPHTNGGPPSTWCHTLTTGPCSGQHTTRTTILPPPCKTPPIPLGFPTPPPSPLPNPSGTIPPQDLNQLQGFTGNNGPCWANMPRGVEGIYGDVFDQPGPTRSPNVPYGSEIKDIMLTVTGANGFYQEFHNTTRRFTAAWYHFELKITDYAPGSYAWQVTGTDALGHVTAGSSHSFTVYNDGCPNPPIC